MKMAAKRRAIEIARYQVNLRRLILTIQRGAEKEKFWISADLRRVLIRVARLRLGQAGFG